MKVAVKIVEQRFFDTLQEMLNTHNYIQMKEVLGELRRTGECEEELELKCFQNMTDFLDIEEFYDRNILQYAKLSGFLRQVMGQTVFEVWNMQEGLEIMEEIELYFVNHDYRMLTEFLQHNLTIGKLALFFDAEIDEGENDVTVAV